MTKKVQAIALESVTTKKYPVLHHQSKYQTRAIQNNYVDKVRTSQKQQLRKTPWIL